MKSLSVGLAAIGLACLLPMWSNIPLAADNALDWARGTGENFELRIVGEAIEADGKQAGDISVSGRLIAIGAEHDLEFKVKGSRFETWLPVNRHPWHSLWICVVSSDGQRVAYKKIVGSELRHAATNGLTFQLAVPTRRIVSVQYQGKPVPHAWVQAELGYGIKMRAEANDEGVAHFNLLPNQELTSFTAWTRDYKMGGFSFNRKPTRDPDANEFTVELSQCHEKLLRVVDEERKPVSGLDLVLQMATLPENNFIGTNDNSRLKTDEKGEIRYSWFPNWEKRNCYIETRSKLWLPEMGHEEIDNAIVFKVNKSKIAQRKRVTGRLSGTEFNPSGFHVTLRSFQGEQKNYSDVLSAYTDVDGSFTLDVLPDATYCAYALDADYVCQPIDLIPYDSSTGRATSPDLQMSKGQKVEVRVTSGPSNRPLPNLSVSFRKEHRFSWKEDGRSEGGIGGPAWLAKTDESGVVVTYAPLGNLKISVFSPQWRTEQVVDVSANEVAKVSLHSPFDKKQKVVGQLVLDKSAHADLSGAEIQIGSIDGQYEERQTLNANTDGSFAFEAMSSKLGLFARTKDGKAARLTVIRDLTSPIKLELRPSTSFAGQLLGDGDRPSADHKIEASIRIEANGDNNGKFVRDFEANHVTAETDSEGKYLLKGLPTETKIVLIARSKSNSKDSSRYLGEVYLEPGETRPPVIHRIGATSSDSAKIPLAERFAKTVRDCRLMGFRMMVIISTDDATSMQFVDRYLVSYDENKDVSSFMQLTLTHRDLLPRSENAAFAEKRGWKIPDKGKVFAYAIDDLANDLGKVEIDLADPMCREFANKFVSEFAPERVDAKKKWDEAFEEARRSNKRVWARTSQRYCGPCFRFARWLDDHRELLAKDFVMLKIDDFRDINGVEVAQRLTRGKHHGIPFHCIFDSSESLLIDSAGNLGNIGHPSGFEGKKHLRRMLVSSCKVLSATEVDKLVASIED